MAHETAIHRRDAEEAAGTPGGFDAALAVDGIDEQLGVFVPMAFKHADFGGSGQNIHLHSTDTGDGWLITVHANATDWRRGHDENADVTARASASDLYLLVWTRLPANQVDVAGDRDLLIRWQTAGAF
jgi:hypothetical protein